MLLSPALRYFLLLKTEGCLLSTFFSNTVYVPLIRETYFLHPQETAGKIVVLYALSKLKVTIRVINICPSVSFLGLTPLPAEYF